MQETTATATATPIESGSSAAPIDFADHLPLYLIKSEVIPPAPTRSESAIDWLPDFAGYSWIAYGASSLLVISHLPSPASDTETLIGPIFRQVLELSSDGSGSVSAVSWSPASPPLGELAAALDNCIGLFSYGLEGSNGSFCWSQTTVLVQSTKVEALKWTFTGDGIISGGSEVVLWRKKPRSWEIAWKYKPEVPHVLVSATWSIEGPSATAPSSQLHAGSSSTINEASNCVLVCHRSDRESNYLNAELRHPLPVSMIQWRPSTEKQPKSYERYSMRLVLLTCCLDGTIRLWSEIDDGRARKVGKDINDQRMARLSFRVCAVVEINQEMNGSLGSDIFVRWATGIDGMGSFGEDKSQSSSPGHYQHDRAGRCEWLIAFGPRMLVTLWAIHCLDDVAPIRFPRVTLWKREELMGPEVGRSSLLLNKVVITRNQVYGPPTVCSLLLLLPCNSLAWLQLNSQKLTSIREDQIDVSRSENLSSCCPCENLNINGHNGNILQVAMHSYGCEFDIAASVDTQGLVLFWSVSPFSNCILGLPTLNPTWKLCGKIAVQDPHLKYSTLRWGPAISDEDGVLLMGHGRGIDCLIVKILKSKEEKLLFHNLCTIPFSFRCLGEGPTNVYSIPLPSDNDQVLVCNTFLLLAVWRNDFQALSWKITIYPFDLSESSSGLKDTAENNVWTCETIFVGKKYCVSVYPCSSVLPDPQSLSQVTSFATVSPTNFVLSEEEKCGSYTAYHMVTGCFDGSLKLWRSILAQSSNSISQWELVGMLAADQGPILKASTTECGRKIATTSTAEESNTSTDLHIWNTVHLSSAGSLILEDAFSLNGEVVALNWLTMGNGHLLLGVCLSNELRVYGQRRRVRESIVKLEKYLEGNIWFCLALTKTYSPIRDFFWGPKNTAVVVHDEYFCLISQWLSLADKKLQTDCPAIIKDHKCDCNGGSYEYMNSAIFTGFSDCDSNGSLLEDNNGKYRSMFPVKMNVRNDFLSSISVESHKQTCNSGVRIGFWSLLEVAEHFVGSLPVYHPEALLMNICSGNWKRAHVALQHLVEYLTSNHASSKRYWLAAPSDLVPPVHLRSYLEGILSSGSSDNTFQWNGDAALTASSTQLQKGPSPFASSWYSDVLNNSSTSSSTRTELGALVEPIEKSFYLAAITITEKMQILSIIDLLDEITNLHSASAYGSLDEPGRRFWVAVRFQKLYFVRRFGRLPSVEDLVIDSELTAWAFHSDCQENLFNSLLSNEPSWQEMRNIGVGFWYTNATQLRLKMEKLARQQYLKSKDPKACALLYIALNRLQVLAGLFKISKDEKDKPLVGFLLRNFQEDKNKAAALKNAYVLLGRHQLELACAFFLLGGDAASAISVCAKNIGDEQLALVICRLVEGCGGLLERHLISKFLLPSAVERGNYWFASFLEWVIGNHLQAFLSMLGVQMDSLNGKSALFSNHASFLDPSIGQYCLMLATKNSMKNSIGERNAAILSRWAILMTATAFCRCGLPLEALECDSSSLSIFGVDQESVSDDANPELLHKILKPFPNTSSSNWILNDVAFHLLSYDKLDLAMQYITKLLTEHPSWPKNNFASPGACSSSEVKLQQYKIIAVFLRNNGLAFIAYHISLCFTSKEPSNQKNSAFDGSLLYPILPNLLLNATEEMPYLFSRYIVACSITCSHLQSCSMENSITDRTRVAFLAVWEFYMHGLTWSLWRLRAALELFSVSCTEDLIKIPFIILDLSEYYAYFASAWLQMNLKAVVLAVKPLLITRTNGYTPNDIDFEDLHRLLSQLAELLAHNSLIVDVGFPVQVNEGMQHEQDGEMMPSLPVDKRWQIITASLWGHMSVFLEHQLNSFPEKLENNYSSFMSLESSSRSKPDSNSIKMQIELISVGLGRLLRVTCSHISSCCSKQLASLLLQKVGDQSTSPALLWLEELYQLPRAYHKDSTQGIDSLNTTENDTQLSASDILWEFCYDPKLLHKSLTQENPELPQYIKQKLCKGWSDIYTCVAEESEADITTDKESRLGGSFADITVGSPVRSVSSHDHSLMNPGVKDTTSRKKATHFQNPKEVYRRNGELLEALCINSVDQQHAALASNRKGIIFFNLEDRLPSIDKSDYIWTEADWPPDGWAGSESSPVPTFVSPGVGLGSKKGIHLGLGGATIGVGSSARPGRDFTGGGAFGIPGYAGIGASGFGWETQEDFEEFVDPPATVENVRTRAFSSHPSRPFFLVGSSNTHVYLWEFGKDTATATYGVLPAANVPPPYALASISAVKFDHCGQRFATAAFDGTTNSWLVTILFKLNKLD
ncbi:hypothetical protein RJ640_004014 [Escallonia rubra]|uniref:RAVE complex protein Rav1 C-terminal domain-containing protein n=1 Tax=Escallonia rubra TaxID=112253 RepID=A0AA88QYC3_9ASTE|nr:hypothetical protein RJ640_004014 [Escallonia rubra]